MKAFCYNLFLTIGIISLTSCEINEKVVINPDGSGDFSYDWKMGGNFFKQLSDLSATDNPPKAYDTMRLDKVNWSDYINDNLSKKEIRDNKEFLEKFHKNLEGYTITTIGQNNKPNQVALYKHFSNLSQIENAPEVMTNFMILGAIQEGKNKKDPKEKEVLDFLSALNSKYSFDGKKFSKTISKEAIQQLKKENNKSKEKSDVSIDKLGEEMTKALSSGMNNLIKYNVEYHFPKRIIESSQKDATYSLDGKMMKINYNILDLVSHPEKFNFELQLEP